MPTEFIRNAKHFCNLVCSCWVQMLCSFLFSGKESNIVKNGKEKDCSLLVLGIDDRTKDQHQTSRFFKLESLLHRAELLKNSSFIKVLEAPTIQGSFFNPLLLLQSNFYVFASFSEKKTKEQGSAAYLLCFARTIYSFW